MARRLGARVRRRDRLVSHCVYGSAQPAKRGAGFTFVEATDGGWWYTAPLPEKRRVLAFHTDADLESARMPSAGQALVDRVGSGSEFGALLEECRFQPDQFATVSAAHTAVVDPPAGPTWLATGDAALAFDPLSAQGILNALFTGLAAAYTADRCLSGDHAAIRHYVSTLEGIHVTHCQRLDTCYAAETRWPSAPFWRRRQQPQAAL